VRLFFSLSCTLFQSDEHIRAQFILALFNLCAARPTCPLFSCSHFSLVAFRALRRLLSRFVSALFFFTQFRPNFHVDY
jgi:hypothetical protein